MNDRTRNIVGHIDRIKDAIVHGRKFDSQEAVHWLCHAADMIEQMDSRIVGMERCLRNQSRLMQESIRERDAAVRDMASHKGCEICKYWETLDGQSPCSECLESRKAWDRWEWRGVCAENEHD